MSLLEELIDVEGLLDENGNFREKCSSSYRFRPLAEAYAKWRNCDATDMFTHWKLEQDVVLALLWWKIDNVEKNDLYSTRLR